MVDCNPAGTILQETCAVSCLPGTADGRDTLTLSELMTFITPLSTLPGSLGERLEICLHSKPQTARAVFPCFASAILFLHLVLLSAVLLIKGESLVE